MKYKFEHFSLIAILFCFIASSCGNQKFLRSHSLSPEKPRKRVFDEYMVVKNKFNFLKQNYKIQEDFDNLSYELSSILQQSPDRSLIRAFRQWVYHLNDTLSYPYKYNKEHKAIMLDTVERKPNGLQKWLYNKVGSGPMILDTALTRRTAESMQRFLNQKSYFNAEVSYDIRKVRHRAIVTYNIKTGMPLLIDTVSWLSKDTLIKEILEDIKGLTVLKPRATISSNNLSLEKKRLTLAIRNRGYYNFNWNYIVIQADTANAVKVNAHKKSMFNKNFEQGEPRAKIYLEVLPFSDTSISHPIYNICNVYITPNDLILKAHQKRVIKKDSFFVVERTIRDRQKILVLKGDDIIQPKDIIRKEKIRKNGEKIRWVERSVPRLKKVTLNSRNDILPGDKVIHIILRKIVKNKKDEEANVKQKKKKYLKT